jgi:hypothetical protein
MWCGMNTDVEWNEQRCGVECTQMWSGMNKDMEYNEQRCDSICAVNEY